MVIDLGMAGDKCFVKGGVATNASGVRDIRDGLWELWELWDGITTETIAYYDDFYLYEFYM
jgi:hypothetical protein